jgi:hypothetical protein
MTRLMSVASRKRKKTTVKRKGGGAFLSVGGVQRESQVRRLQSCPRHFRESFFV